MGFWRQRWKLLVSVLSVALLFKTSVCAFPACGKVWNETRPDLRVTMQVLIGPVGGLSTVALCVWKAGESCPEAPIKART